MCNVYLCTYNTSDVWLTLGCILSPSFTNSALPFPALASPSTSDVEAPEPIPNVKHLNQIRNHIVCNSGKLDKSDTLLKAYLMFLS